MKFPKLLFVVFVCLTAAALAQNATVLPSGAEIKVRTDVAIPARPPADATYSATVSNDVISSKGELAIPRSARAELVAVPTDDGKDTNLDLRSVIVNDHKYLLVTKGSSNSSRPGGLGANKRTGKYVGGGAAIGAVLGAILGGGKGAAVGAILGGAGGAGAQVYTGKKKELPPETQLSFKLAQDLEMESAPASSQGQQTPPAPPPVNPQNSEPAQNAQPPQSPQTAAPPENTPSTEPAQNAPTVAPPQNPQPQQDQQTAPPPQNTQPPENPQNSPPPDNTQPPQNPQPPQN
jgi:hypothetical protein